MPMAKNIAILILAAGASTRMGTPKQLLPWKDTTLLGNAIETAKVSLAEEVFVVLGANYKKIRLTASEEIVLLNNPNWQNGLGTSIAAGVEHITRKMESLDAVLIMLVDQPLISADHLNRLIHSFQENDKYIVATNYGKRAGVPVVFGKKYFEALAKLDGDNGAKKLIDSNRDDTIVLDTGENLTDLDTKLEYERLLKRMKN